MQQIRIVEYVDRFGFPTGDSLSFEKSCLNIRQTITQSKLVDKTFTESHGLHQK